MSVTRNLRALTVALALGLLAPGVTLRADDDQDKTPDILLPIASVSPDGSTIAFGKGKSIVVTVTSKTEISYVKRGDRKLSPGQVAAVWLVRGSYVADRILVKPSNMPTPNDKVKK